MIHFKSNRVLFSVLLIAVTGAPLSAEETPEPPTTDVRESELGPAAEKIAKLARELSHQDYNVRQSATRQLPLLGNSVIEPITEVALQNNLEASLRAVSVLEQLYLSEDVKSFDRAEASLKRLIDASTQPAVAQKANQILADNQFTVTQRRAIAEVRRLGGQIQMQRDYPVLVNGEHIRPEQGWAQAAAINRHWKGGDEGLKYLSRLTTLRSIYLVDGHSLSEEAIDHLRHELPDAEFQTRGRAMLGVSTESKTLGCLIRMVRPDSAAGKAGMQAGDYVVEIAGKPVRQSEDLISLIGEHNEGENIEIIVLRGDPILRYKLLEMMQQPEEFSPIVAIAIVSQMRTKFTVSLGEWSIDG